MVTVLDPVWIDESSSSAVCPKTGRRVLVGHHVWPSYGLNPIRMLRSRPEADSMAARGGADG